MLIYTKPLLMKALMRFIKVKTQKKMVSAVQNSKIAPGKLSQQDLAQYKSKERDAVCIKIPWFITYVLWHPPSSGGMWLFYKY